MKNTLRTILLCAMLASALTSCESMTSTNLPFDSTVVHSSDRALFVLNEGGGAGQSSLDVVIFRSSPTMDTLIRRNVLSQLGEGNDLCMIGNRAFIVDHGSNQLVVVDADSLKTVASIGLGVNGPNKIAQIGPHELLVTQRASAYAAIVDANTNTITDSILVGMNAAAVGLFANKAFVTTSIYLKPGALQIIDLSNKNVLKTLGLVSSPETLAVDSVNGQIIVGCDGDYKTVPPVIYFIDASSMSIRDSLVVGPPGTQYAMVFGDRLYLVEGSAVNAVNLTSHAVTPLAINSSNSYYNGFYDPRNKQVFLGRKNYTSAGTVDVFDATTAVLEWSFPAGIAPAHFAFYH